MILQFTNVYFLKNWSIWLKFFLCVWYCKQILLQQFHQNWWFFYIPFGHLLNFPPKSAQKENFFFEFLGFKMEFYYANGPSWEKKLLWKKIFFYSKLKVLLLCLKHNCTFLENEPTEYFRFGVSELPMGRAFKILHVSSGSFFSGQTPFQTSCVESHPFFF